MSKSWLLEDPDKAPLILAELVGESQRGNRRCKGQELTRVGVFFGIIVDGSCLGAR